MILPSEQFVKDAKHLYSCEKKVYELIFRLSFLSCILEEVFFINRSPGYCEILACLLKSSTRVRQVHLISAACVQGRNTTFLRRRVSDRGRALPTATFDAIHVIFQVLSAAGQLPGSKNARRLITLFRDSNVSRHFRSGISSL